MFSEAKLNFTQPGKDQWRAHTAETEVRLNRALSCISPSSPVCSLAEVGTRWKGTRWNGERDDDRWVPPIHSSSDAFSHLFGISSVVFLWASLRDIQAGEILHLKGQEGEEFTREVHWTCVVKCGCINIRGLNEPPKKYELFSLYTKISEVSGVSFSSQGEGTFPVVWTPDTNFCRSASGCILLFPNCYYIKDLDHL